MKETIKDQILAAIKAKGPLGVKGLADALGGGANKKTVYQYVWALKREGRIRLYRGVPGMYEAASEAEKP